MPSTRRRGPIAILVLLLIALVGLTLWMVLAPGSDGDRDDVGEGTSNAPPMQRDAARAPRGQEIAREHVTSQPGAVQPMPRGGGRDASGPRIPVETPAPARRTVNVTVQREGGVPVRDAHVSAAAAFGNLQAAPANATTDVAGRVALSISGRGSFVVRAWTNDSAAIGERVASDQGESMDVTLTLEPGRATVGRVLSETSTAIEGAQFTLAPYTGDPFGTFLRGTSDAEGRVDLGVVPARVLDDPRSYAFANARGYARQTSTLEDALAQGEVVLRLSRGQTVRGRCVAAGAAAVSGVQVSADGAETATTGGDGRFEINGVPWEGGALFLAPPAHAAPPPLTLPAGVGDIDLGDILLTSGLPISGVVVDDQGRAVAGATLSATQQVSSRTVRSGSSDAEGRFTLPRIGDGPHTITAERADGGDWSAHLSARVTDVSAGTVGLRVVLSGGLTLLVEFKLESDRSPVSVGTVEVEITRTDVDGQQTRSAWTGPGMSSVRIPFEDAGAYRVTVKVPGYEPATLENVTISEDRATRLDALFRAPE